MEHKYWQMDSDNQTNEKLKKVAHRIKGLLELPKGEASSYLIAVLDDFLGAVFALAQMTKASPSWNGRPRQRTFRDPKILAGELVRGDVRSQGNWMAGFHFNSALFRLAAVYHRGLKVVAGKEKDKNIYVGELLQIVEPAYEQVKGRSWGHEMLKKVHEEVNDLKHTTTGVAIKRDVDLDSCLAGIHQLLDLLETWIGSGEWEKYLGQPIKKGKKLNS